MFQEELAYFIAHQEELVAEHKGKVLTLRGSAVVDAHATMLEAYLAAMRQFEPGTFMLQRCESGPGAYTVTISTLDLSAGA